MSLRMVPITIAAAREFVARQHRHLKRSPPSGKFAVGVAAGPDLVGVAIAGRPSARMFDDGWSLEVTRVATDGTRNACSVLYGAVVRAGKAMGYRRFITYTLEEEGGASLRAAGWQRDGEAGGGSWERDQKPEWRPRSFRADQRTDVKVRWVLGGPCAEPLPVLPEFEDDPAPRLGL